MAAIYPKAKEQMMKGLLNLTSASITAVLLKNTYVYSDADDSVSVDVTTAKFATPVGVTLTSVTVDASGVFDAADVTFTAVAGGSTVDAILLYSGDIPIAYINSGVGVPFATSGADVTITWSSGASKIFKL